MEGVYQALKNEEEAKALTKHRSTNRRKWRSYQQERNKEASDKDGNLSPREIAALAAAVAGKWKPPAGAVRNIEPSHPAASHSGLRRSSTERRPNLSISTGLGVSRKTALIHSPSQRESPMLRRIKAEMKRHDEWGVRPEEADQILNEDDPQESIDYQYYRKSRLDE